MTKRRTVKCPKCQAMTEAREKTCGQCSSALPIGLPAVAAKLSKYDQEWAELQRKNKNVSRLIK